MAAHLIEPITAALMDRLLVLSIALALSAVLLNLTVRRMLMLPALATRFDAWVQTIERKLNRSHRNTGTLVYRGMLVLLVMVVAVIAISVLVAQLVSGWRYGIYVEMVLLAMVLPLRPLGHMAREIARLMATRNEAKARALLQAHTGYEATDTHSIARATLEQLIEQWAATVMATAFWYSALGLPGALLVRVVARLHDHIGVPASRYLAFGWAAGALHTLLQAVPARLGALVLVVAATLVPKARALAAAHMLWRDRGNSMAAHSGWPLAVAAGALNLTLAGPKRAGEALIRDAWIGNGTAKATQHDLMRGLWLYGTATLLLQLLCLAGVWGLR